MLKITENARSQQKKAKAGLERATRQKIKRKKAIKELNMVDEFDNVVGKAQIVNL